MHSCPFCFQERVPCIRPVDICDDVGPDLCMVGREAGQLKTPLLDEGVFCCYVISD